MPNEEEDELEKAVLDTMDFMGKVVVGIVLIILGMVMVWGIVMLSPIWGLLYLVRQYKHVRLERS